MRINNYDLDKEQENIVLDNSKHLLVIAGAGSGKTLTILGKIKYLIEEKNIKEDEILCISFTNKASISLQEKIKKEFDLNMNVYTFHKLGLEILKENNKTFEIADTNLLNDIIYKFFNEDIYNYPILLKYKKKYSNKDIVSLSNSISTFIRLLKCNGKDINDYKEFFKRIKFTLSYRQYKSESIFLLLSLNIYLLYEYYLEENNEIDFDDMLIKATGLVKENGIKKKIKYVIIDEYQDTSLVRFNLIKEILLNTNANLMVVGDDFQSIYRFTGCDINLFLDFKKYFPDSKTLKIQSTYRNSKELIKVAGNFVMKNKKQISKRLRSNKSIKKPISIIYYTDQKKELNKLISGLDDYIILGRNNNDINSVPNDLKDKFLTVHKSKGLEWDNVIIINLTNDILGFPNKIKDEKIFRLVLPKPERYLYSEERRLFYVALTRTKNKVYLFIPRRKQSVFVEELVRDYRNYLTFY